MTDIDPHIWGPSFWSTYHLYASSYPIHPTPIIMDAARSFVKTIPFTLPCSSCTDHAFAYIKNIQKQDPNLNSIVSSKMLFEKFFIDFHNSVNYRLGKPLLPESVARKKWTF